MYWKPFHHRLPQRVRTWNLRLDRREPFEHKPMLSIMYSRRRKKPQPIRRALSRARAMRLWGSLFDPELTF